MVPRLNVRALPWFGAAALAMALAACGGGSDGGDTAQIAPATTTSTTTATASTGTPGASTTATASSSASAAAGTPTATATDAPPDPSKGTKSRAVEKVASDNAAQVVVTAIASQDVNNTEAFGFQFTGGIPGYRVEYVDQAKQCGSGATVTIPNAAGTLLVTLKPAIAHDSTGASTVSSSIANPSGEGSPVSNLQSSGNVITGIQQVCDFEGVVQFAVGIKTVANFQVLESDNGTQLAILVNKKN